MNYSRLAPILLALAAVTACQPKSAGTITDNSPPVATVNGAPISRNFYDFYIKGITGGKSPADITAEQRGLALDNLVRAQVVAEQADKDGLDKSGDSAYMLELARLNVLQQAMQDRTRPAAVRRSHRSSKRFLCVPFCPRCLLLGEIPATFRPILSNSAAVKFAANWLVERHRG